MNNYFKVLIFLPFLLFVTSCQKEEVELNSTADLHATIESSSDSDIMYRDFTFEKDVQSIAADGVNKIPGKCKVSIKQGTGANWDNDCRSCNNDNLGIEHYLDEYVNCLIGPKTVSKGKCYNFQKPYFRYIEGELTSGAQISLPCTTSNGTTVDWNYLNDPGFNCDVQASTIKKLGDALYANAQVQVPGWEVIGFGVKSVLWRDCVSHQLLCGNPDFYPCGATFWTNSSPDCSLCKDICESRSIDFHFEYRKLCVSQF